MLVLIDENQILAGKESVQTAVAAIGCGLCLRRGGGFAREKNENHVVRTEDSTRGERGISAIAVPEAEAAAF